MSWEYKLEAAQVTVKVVVWGSGIVCVPGKFLSHHAQLHCGGVLQKNRLVGSQGWETFLATDLLGLLEQSTW